MIIREELDLIRQKLAHALPFIDNSYLAVQKNGVDGLIVSEKGDFMNFNDTLGNYFYLRWSNESTLFNEEYSSNTLIYSTELKCRVVVFINNYSNDLVIAENVLYWLGVIDAATITSIDKIWLNKYYNLEQEAGEKYKNLNLDKRSLTMFDITIMSYITPQICIPLELCKCNGQQTQYIK